MKLKKRRKKQQREWDLQFSNACCFQLRELNRTKIIRDDEMEIVFASPVLIIIFSLGRIRDEGEKKQAKIYTKIT